MSHPTPFRALTCLSLLFALACGAEATEVGIDCTVNAQCFFPDLCVDGRCMRPPDTSDGGVDSGAGTDSGFDAGFDSGFDAGADACTIPLPIASNAFPMGCSFIAIEPGSTANSLAFRGRAQTTEGLCPGPVQTLGEITVRGATFSGSVISDCRMRRVEGRGNEIHFFGSTRSTPSAACTGTTFIGKIDVRGALVTGESRAGCTFRGVRAEAQTIEFLRNSRGPENQCGDFPQESAGILTLEPIACF